MEMNFCRRCGTKLSNIQDHVYTCEQGHSIFANCSPTVGIFILTSNNDVMLSVRSIEPHKGMLDAFGGFLDGEETLETAAARELREELSLEPHEYEPLRYLISAVGHYPFEDEILSVESALFWTRLINNRKLYPSDDVADIKTVPLNAIDMAQLHDDDIRLGIRKLQAIIVTKEN